TRRDAVLHAAAANAIHGLRPSSADRRRSVQALLEDEEWRNWSDREIARRCGVDHKTGAHVRQRLYTGFPHMAAPRLTRPALRGWPGAWIRCIAGRQPGAGPGGRSLTLELPPRTLRSRHRLEKVPGSRRSPRTK